MKNLALLFAFCFFFGSITLAQQADFEKLNEAINSKAFVFEARQATGMRGRMIQLDPGHTLQVSPDKVVGDLPFFGRAFQSTPGGISGGLQFEFSEYTYEVKARRKGGWDITLDPTEPSDVRIIYLTIQNSGNASVRILSNSREGMTYSGFIRN